MLEFQISFFAIDFKFHPFSLSHQLRADMSFSTAFARLPGPNKKRILVSNVITLFTWCAFDFVSLTCLIRILGILFPLWKYFKVFFHHMRNMVKENHILWDDYHPRNVPNPIAFSKFDNFLLFFFDIKKLLVFLWRWVRVGWLSLVSISCCNVDKVPHRLF